MDDSPHTAWESYLPGSGFVFAEEASGLTPEQEAQNRSGGRRLALSDSVRITALSDGQVGDAIGTVWMGRFVSTDLRSVLEASTSARMQFVDASLPVASPRVFLLNLLEVLDCLDRAASDLEYLDADRDVIRAVRRLVLRNLPQRTPELFHVSGLPGLIVVSGRLRSQLEGACPAPGEFVPLDAYRRGIL